MLHIWVLQKGRGQAHWEMHETLFTGMPIEGGGQKQTKLHLFAETMALVAQCFLPELSLF